MVVWFAERMSLAVVTPASNTEHGQYTSIVGWQIRWLRLVKHAAMTAPALALRR